MKIENNGGLRILRPNENMLLFKKSESKDKRNYYEVVYLAKFETMENYGEVTYDYVYGKNYDDKIEVIEESSSKHQMNIELQSGVIDFLLFGDVIDSDICPTNKMVNVNDDIHQMAVYLAGRILSKKLHYSLVVDKFPQYKDDIDFILLNNDFGNLVQ